MSYFSGLSCYKLRYGIEDGKKNRTVIDDFSEYFQREQMVSIIGPSGCGKTTLLSLFSLIVPVWCGSILFEGCNLTSLSRVAREEFRRLNIGFIFQTCRLIPTLTVDQHLELTAKLRRKNCSQIGYQLISELGMHEKLEMLPAQLSGGEKQRVALAQCLMSGANLILADEPTAAVDEKNSRLITHFLLEYAKRNKAVVIVVTHDSIVMDCSDRVIDLYKYAKR